MDDDKLFNDALTVHARFVQYREFWNDLVRTSDLQNSKILSMENRLAGCHSKIDSLQTKKARLEGLAHTSETNMDDLMAKTKQHDILRTHLDTLNQRKHILEEYTVRKGLEIEEEKSKNKLDEMWIYFKVKNAQLLEEIKIHESRLDRRRDMVSKMYKKKYNKYKQLTKKLNDENDILKKTLYLINNPQKD